MIFKLRFGKMRLTITLAPVIDVIGVNSLLPDGNHILMWDFDDVELMVVKSELRMKQNKWWLPNIYILRTKEPNNYIAYCLCSMPWETVVAIIASTGHVCWNFFKWGVFRHRFTLRVSPKCGRKPKLIAILRSNIPETCNVEQLHSWVQYETLPDDRKHHIIKLGEK